MLKSLQFLIDEDLPRSTKELLEKKGYHFFDVRDIGMRGANDAEIAAFARKKKLCILTGDFDFSDIRSYPPEKFSGIVILNPTQQNVTARHFLNLLSHFLEQKDLLHRLAGRLMIVQPDRIRIRSSS